MKFNESKICNSKPSFIQLISNFPPIFNIFSIIEFLFIYYISSMTDWPTVTLVDSLGRCHMLLRILHFLIVDLGRKSLLLLQFLLKANYAVRKLLIY